MREHLYKAKRVNWKELPKEEWWVGGDLIHEPYGTVIQYYENEIKDKGNCAKIKKRKRIKVVVEPETVCEYTGLTDKNDRKIFEGDILRFEDYSNYPVVWDSDYCTFGSCWYSDFDHLSKYRSIKIEAVGNIFDNSELLEGGDVE